MQKFQPSRLTPEQRKEAATLDRMTKAHRGLQARVSKRLNVTPATVNQVVAGLRPLQLEMAAAFAVESGEPLASFSPRLARQISMLAQQAGSRGEPSSRHTLQRIRAKGIATMNAEGFWRVDEVKPLDGRIQRVTGDPDTYAIRIEGDALEPRYQSGDYIIVRPAAPCEAGRPVYVVLLDGRATIRDLVRQAEGIVVLRNIRDGSRMTLKEGEVYLMQRVVGQADPIEFVAEG